MKSLTKQLRIVIAVFCFVAAIVLFKVEVIDHQWMVFERDAKGYVEGWNTPEGAITKGSQWKGGTWDFEILSRDAFRVRQKVNAFTGYVLPLAFVFAALVALFTKQTQNS